MKIVIGALLLCWLSLCQASTQTCEQLVIQAPSRRDVSGRWYAHALSTDSCMSSSITFALYKLTLVFDIKGTPSRYKVTIGSKVITECKTRTFDYGYDFYLLPSCPDCIVLKEDSFFFGPSYMLLSPQPTIDAAVMKQFEEQAACIPSSYTQPLNNDFDLSNCQNLDANVTVKVAAVIAKRVEDFMPQAGVCIAKLIWNRFQEETGLKV